jgi:hypothetical protein
MHPDLYPLQLIDPDDLDMLLTWLINHLETEPDSDDPFYMLERTETLRHASLTKGIDYEAAHSRIMFFLRAGMMQCLYAADLSADAAALQDRLPKLAALLWYSERFGLGDPDDHNAFFIMERLLRRGPIPFRTVALLADMDAGPYRKLAAEHLKGANPHEIQLLQKLIKDPDQSVRAVASTALAASGAIPWWEGVFASDPTPYLTDEADEAAARAWMTICQKLGKYTRVTDATAQALAALPLIPRREALRVFLRDHDVASRYADKLGPLLAPVPDAHLVLDELIKRWHEYALITKPPPLDALLAFALPETQQALWALAYQALPTASPEYGSTFSHLPDMLIRFWPDDVPYDALFACILRPRKANETDHAAGDLMTALADLAHQKPTLPWDWLAARFCESAQADASPWSPKVTSARKLLEAAPGPIKEQVARAWIASSSDKHIAWVLEHMHFAPTTPPEVIESHLWSCWGDARMRSALLSSEALTVRFSAWLRKRLIDPQETTLTSAEVCAILRSIRVEQTPSPFSSLLTHDPFLHPLFLVYVQHQLAAHERGPRVESALLVTAEEWDVVRAVRQRISRTSEAAWSEALCLFPAIRRLWTAEDIALVEEASALYERRSPFIAVLSLGAALFVLQPPDILERFARMLQDNLFAKPPVIAALKAALSMSANALGVPIPQVPGVTFDDDDEDDNA